ncbi:hypothetical protein ABUT75_002321 [Flavobacterium psychrophilum]
MATIFTNIKERILHLTDLKSVTKEKFFESIGVTYGNFKGKAKEKSLSSDVLAKIVTMYPDVNPFWLLNGTGEVFLKEDYLIKQDQQLIELKELEYKNLKVENSLLKTNTSLLNELCNELKFRIKTLDDEIEQLKKENNQDKSKYTNTPVDRGLVK